MDGNINAEVLLLKGGQEEESKVVFGVESEVVEKGQVSVLDDSEVERAAVDVDVGVEGVVVRIFEKCCFEENAGPMDGLHVVPQFAELLLLSSGDRIYVHRLKPRDSLMFQRVPRTRFVIEQEIRIFLLLIEQILRDQSTEAVVDNLPGGAKRFLVEVFPEKRLPDGFCDRVAIVSFGGLV